MFFILQKSSYVTFSILLQTVSALFTWNIWSCGGRCRWLTSCVTLDFSHFNILFRSLCDLHVYNIQTRCGRRLDRWARGIVGRRTALFDEHVGIQRLTPAIYSEMEQMLNYQRDHIWPSRKARSKELFDICSDRLRVFVSMVTISDWPLETDESASTGDSAAELLAVVSTLPSERWSEIKSDGRFVVS